MLSALIRVNPRDAGVAMLITSKYPIEEVGPSKMIKDKELDALIEELETNADMPLADFEGVLNALTFVLPGSVAAGTRPESLAVTDGALLVADDAYPNWTVRIHGRANDRNGHWHCTIRKDGVRDNDAAIGSGRSPVLAQAILASVLRLATMMDRSEASA